MLPLSPCEALLNNQMLLRRDSSDTKKNHIKEILIYEKKKAKLLNRMATFHKIWTPCVTHFLPPTSHRCLLQLWFHDTSWGVHWWAMATPYYHPPNLLFLDPSPTTPVSLSPLLILSYYPLVSLLPTTFYFSLCSSSFFTFFIFNFFFIVLKNHKHIRKMSI